jgi:hypothetical protein
MAQGFTSGGPSSESGGIPGFSVNSGRDAAVALDRQAESAKASGNALLRAVDSSIKFADEAFRESAREDAKVAAEEVQKDTREAFFAREVQQQAITAMPETTPKEVQDKERELNRLKAAYDNGALTDTHYWSRLDATARSLRARYPGYADEIDQTISRISGGKPANQVIGAMLSQVEAENKRRTTDEWSELWKTGKHVPGIAAADAQGIRLPVPEMRRLISDWESKEAIRKKASAELDYTSSSFSLETRRSEEGRKTITRGATEVVNLETSSVLEKVLAPLAPHMDALAKAQAAGQAPSSEALKNIAASIPQMRLQAQAQIEQIFNRKRESGRSMFELVQDQAEIDRLRKGAMERLDLTLDAYSKGDGAVLSTLKMFNDLSAQGGEAAIRSDEFANRLSGLRKIGIPEFDISMAIKLNGPMRRGYENLINTKLAVLNNEGVASGKNTLGTFMEKMSQPNISADTRNKSADEMIKMMADPKASIETKEKFYNFLFGDNKPGKDIMSKLAPGTQRDEFFAKMVNPRGLEAIKSLEASKPGTIDKFRQWVEHNGKVHLFELMNTANVINERKGSHLIVYNAEDQRFVVRPNPGFRRDQNLTVPTDPNAAYQAVVSSANRAVASLAPAFQLIYPKRDQSQQLANFVYDSNFALREETK